ncbi:hypothetical protein BC832DRAFT_550742 [Gaertneriomyces semiglobifer]|nr:hypothetical protein BC832DRAFT_550742 [Gaertneriomyces semiglobifer]
MSYIATSSRRLLRRIRRSMSNLKNSLAPEDDDTHTHNNSNNDTNSHNGSETFDDDDDLKENKPGIYIREVVVPSILLNDEPVASASAAAAESHHQEPQSTTSNTGRSQSEDTPSSRQHSDTHDRRLASRASTPSLRHNNNNNNNNSPSPPNNNRLHPLSNPTHAAAHTRSRRNSVPNLPFMSFLRPSNTSSSNANTSTRRHSSPPANTDTSHPPPAIDATPLYTQHSTTLPSSPLPPSYHLLTTHPQKYTITTLLPRGTSPSQTLQVFVFDDAREVGVAGSDEQMGIRVPMPEDADLKSVRASVRGGVLCISIARSDVA